ncbi:major facilitator superfamily MFS_1 [Elusimicrobium minutum Pei191]|uniref:Major facilitator superfamily MFS_1 n=1 Tax=Elusimicrobium minutum (strain Pei191) TaxID=445932 RepID=B2KAU2_ELUMP|nr:MFS transporter [Elusimicrobium minutum]ACC97638.1 major facilitator superfamily MFS_1 [Elusimicrobium minutum Pei191]
MKKTWFFIPTLYFAEGLPFVIVNVVSPVIYTKLGVAENIMSFYTGFLYLPWVLKMFWSPLLENKSKRSWVLGTQLALSAVFVLIALSFQLNNYFLYSLIGFFTGAFISATYDIATDGYYMLALDKKEQAFFVGIRTFFYRLAMIFASGILVMIAGVIEERTGNIPLSWTAAMFIASGVFGLFFVFHIFILHKERIEETVKNNTVFTNFFDSFKAYFTQKNIVIIICFILFYRLGEASFEKMIPPFLTSARELGGLGMSTKMYGFVKGTIGIISLMAGNILGGIALSKYGFKKCIWPFVIMLNVPTVFYVILAIFQPGALVTAALLSFEQFGYGLGFMAFTVFIMNVSIASKYATSHYAISTGIMGLGMMVPSMLSGSLKMALGYTNFFILACFLSIPSFLLIPFVLKIYKGLEGGALHNAD